MTGTMKEYPDLCMIIHCPPNSRPKDRLIKSIYRSNPDGLGVFYPQDGKVIASKIMPTSEDAAVKFIRSFDTIKDVELGIHFRFKTSGALDLTCAHPIEILSDAEHGRDLWLMHNGVIPIQTTQTESDTVLYTKVLRKTFSLYNFPEPPFSIQEISDLVKLSIGKGNKLLILDGKAGKFYRINEECGHKIGNTWFSAYPPQSHSNLPQRYFQGSPNGSHYYFPHNNITQTFTGYKKTFRPGGDGEFSYTPGQQDNSKVRVRIFPKTKEVLPLEHPTRVMEKILAKNIKKDPGTLIPIAGKKLSLSDLAGRTDVELRQEITREMASYASILQDMITKEGTNA